MLNSELYKGLKDYNSSRNVKCTWRLVLLHVAEKTIENPEFTFTSVDIHEAFGCSREAASLLISRSVGRGSYIKIDTMGHRPFMYKISKTGIKRADKIIKLIGEINNGE